MKTKHNLGIVISIVLILLNLLNIEYDNLPNLAENKSHLLNLLLGILLLIYFIIEKSKKQSETDTLI